MAGSDMSLKQQITDDMKTAMRAICGLWPALT